MPEVLSPANPLRIRRAFARSGTLMPLTDKPPEATKRGGCGIAKCGFTDAELARVNEWIDDPKYSDYKVSLRLAEDDYRVSGQVISHHRRRTCACYR